MVNSFVSKLTQTQTTKVGVMLVGIAILAAVVLLSSSVSAAGFSAGNGIEVLSPVLNKSIPTWHLDPNFDNHPVVELFINQPVHMGTYTRGNVPLQYRVEYGVCQNIPSRTRVIARYDANGGWQSTFLGDSNVNWKEVHNQVHQTNGCTGVNFCLGTTSFNGVIALSELPATATKTTVQVVAKWNNNTTGIADQPNSDLSLSDQMISLGYAHAFNIWLHIPTPTPTPTATPTATPTPTPEVEKEEEKELDVEKTDHKDITRPGHSLTYVITVHNGGNVDINDLKITDSVPSQLTVTAIGNNGKHSGSTITWSNISLGAGETQQVTYKAMVKSDTKNNTVITNKVKANSQDHDLEDNATDTTLVKTAPQVLATTTPVPVPVTAKTGAGALTAIVASLSGAAGLIVTLRKQS